MKGLRLPRSGLVLISERVQSVFASMCGVLIFLHCPIVVSRYRSICQPFNARAGHCSGRHVFGYNSLVAIARELFKPSTDAAGLLGSINFFFLFRWGVRLGGARKVGVCLDFRPILTGPGRQSNGPKCWLKLCLETAWSPASIKPLIDLLACLEPKLWPQTIFYLQNQKMQESPTGGYCSWR